MVVADLKSLYHAPKERSIFVRPKLRLLGFLKAFFLWGHLDKKFFTVRQWSPLSWEILDLFSNCDVCYFLRIKGIARMFQKGQNTLFLTMTKVWFFFNFFFNYWLMKKIQARIGKLIRISYQCTVCPSVDVTPSSKSTIFLSNWWNYVQRMQIKAMTIPQMGKQFGANQGIHCAKKALRFRRWSDIYTGTYCTCSSFPLVEHE